jgi:hypothetical protein
VEGHLHRTQTTTNAHVLRLSPLAAVGVPLRLLIRDVLLLDLLMQEGFLAVGSGEQQIAITQCFIVLK